MGYPTRLIRSREIPSGWYARTPAASIRLLISAQYAGFRTAHDDLIELTGVDVIPELQPVDIHVTNDAKCGTLAESPALSYAWHAPQGNAYLCTFLFEYAQGYNGQPYSPDVAIRRDQQIILVHEYFHAIFFGRLDSQAGAQHDFVTPLAMLIGGQLNGDAELCNYHPQTPPGDFGGYLIQQLCQQNGFTLEKMTASLVELDTLTRSGGGQLQEGFSQPVPTMAQYRQILSSILGSDTTNAFVDACWPSSVFGESYNLPAACLNRTPTVKPTPLK